MMANNLPERGVSSQSVATTDRQRPGMIWVAIVVLFDMLSSIKLTVTLMVMAIFIVMVGTMAQVDKGIWQVIDEYFRTPVAWVEWRILIPRQWFPALADMPGGIPFPGGWLIGFLMAINMVAAYATRLRVHARGPRLVAGVAALVLGALLTWLVVASGSNKNVVGNVTEMDSSTLWILIQAGFAALALTAICGLIRIGSARKIEWWALLAVVVGVSGLLIWIRGTGAAMNDSALRILWQLAKGGVSSLVLLAGCGLLFRDRAGIVLLHAGILLLMLGELLVGMRSIEGTLRVKEGETVNFIEQDRALELAVVDDSGSTVGDTVVVPAEMLRPGKTIQDQSLPFDIRVLEFFSNSIVGDAADAKHNLATAGMGLQVTAVEEPDAGRSRDDGRMAATYVEFLGKGSSRSYGIYLVSRVQSYLGVDEVVSVDGKEYHVSLRPKRIYKPYSIRLIDFQFDKYVGTDKAKNFSSDLRLTDSSRGVDRKVRIWMNNPLRYAGDTLYQNDFEWDLRTGSEVTILQVVSNSSWMIPYVSCGMVAMGMFFHFGVMLLHFLKQRELVVELGSGTASSPNPGRKCERDAAAWFPAVAAFGSVILFASLAWPHKIPDGKMQIDKFGMLPVIYEGRIKPIDTLARNSLVKISGEQSFKDQAGEKQSAIRWLLGLIAGKPESGQYPLFRIDNRDVLHALGLERRKGLRYSWDEVRKNSEEFAKQVQLARAREKGRRGVYERKLLELASQVQMYRLLRESFRSQVRGAHVAEDLPAAIQHARKLVSFHPPLVIPELVGTEQAWQPFASAWTTAQAAELAGKEPNRTTVLFADMMRSYLDGDSAAGEFNASLDEYGRLLLSNPPENLDMKKVAFEAWVNHWQPFFWCAVLYVLAFVLSVLAWLGWSEPLNRAAFWMIVVVLVIHTAALVARIYISGYPPVTNLYSTAVFIGWGCVVLGLIIEVIYRLGVGNILAEVAGFTTLLVAFFLSRQGDTLGVLVAVLDTQFWLATHVTCITLGYSATFVAGGLGVLYVLRGVCTPSLSPHVSKELSRMIYGAVCFSIFFSFIGTVLGGLWADDSWGRFWGWDPKENGALIIVLWNALVLHARWRGLVKDRGLALLAIGGNICTAWSWFGVNELGVGLHSYGFTNGVLFALGLFCLSQLIVIGIGLLPPRMWWSSRVREMG